MIKAIAGVLLGLIFIFASVAYFFHLVTMPTFPPGSPIAMFFGAFGPTHYMDFVKVFELSGGILVAIPATRRLGMLLLGPVIVNILAFHIFITRNFNDPIMIGAVVLAIFLLWAERHSFAAFIAGSPDRRAPGVRSA